MLSEISGAILFVKKRAQICRPVLFSTKFLLIKYFLKLLEPFYLQKQRIEIYRPVSFSTKFLLLKINSVNAPDVNKIYEQILTV